MKSDRRAPVAIIGAGFSGTVLAAQLARKGIRSLLIEGSGREGRGTAYSTRDPAHLLNVRAEAMSAWPDRPADFAEALAAEGGDPRGFAQRRFFGAYVRRILDEAVNSGAVELVTATAVAAERDAAGWSVALSGGAICKASALALAIGNQPPEPLGFARAAGERWIGNPWGPEARQAIAALASSGGTALIVGTGLTMVDLVLSLDAAGHRGRIVALSRRGQMPRSHADYAPAPVAYTDLPVGSLLALWRWLRRRSGEVGFRAAVDSLRPHTQALWQALPLDQQQRFLRHARPWWDTHRHRIAPHVARRLMELVAEGRLEILAGRICSVQNADQSAMVELKRRGAAAAASVPADYIFNCTGPLGAIGRTRDPLLKGLLDRGAVRTDPLGIGLDVDECSRLGAAEQRLWALGPLTKGRYWEIVAVPDIRVQAAAVADDIARELQQ